MTAVFVVNSSLMTQAESYLDAAKIFVAKRGIPSDRVVKVWDWNLDLEVFDLIEKPQP